MTFGNVSCGIFEKLPAGSFVVLAAVSIVSLSGCAELSRPANPVISSNLNEDVSTLTTRAERRIVISQYDRKADRYNVCAEPSPDAIEAVAASIERSISVQASAGREASAESLQQLATAAGATLRKSQGLQFFRDGIFALCQGGMNGIEDPDDIITAFENLVKVSERLILAELKTKGWNNPTQLQTVNAPALSQPPKKPAQDGGAKS